MCGVAPPKTFVAIHLARATAVALAFARVLLALEHAADQVLCAEPLERVVVEREVRERRVPCERARQPQDSAVAELVARQVE